MLACTLCLAPGTGGRRIPRYAKLRTCHLVLFLSPQLIPLLPDDQTQEPFPFPIPSQNAGSHLLPPSRPRTRPTPTSPPVQNRSGDGGLSHGGLATAVTSHLEASGSPFSKALSQRWGWQSSASPPPKNCQAAVHKDWVFRIPRHLLRPRRAAHIFRIRLLRRHTNMVKQMLIALLSESEMRLSDETVEKILDNVGHLISKSSCYSSFEI